MPSLRPVGASIVKANEFSANFRYIDKHINDKDVTENGNTMAYNNFIIIL